MVQVRSACDLPILRKDFIIDEYQIYEARNLGTDCILLIVALLSDEQLKTLYEIAVDLGMAVLVESHSKEELLRALKLPTPLIGINNRDLHTFNTSLETTIQHLPLIPQDRIVVSESGIQTHADVAYLQQHGVSTFLIGESLMRSKDPKAHLAQLFPE